MKRRVGWELLIAGIGVLPLGAAACSGAPKTVGVASASAPPKALPPKPIEVHEHITAHTCPARAKLAALLRHGDEAKPVVGAQDGAQEKPQASDPPPISTGGAKLGGADAYRAVAPATVLIRTDNGFGSGVVIDPKGYILTNHHVVADGRKKDFVISVDVTFGDLTPTGRMQRQEKSYDAVVVKDDPIRDLALVKVTDPPPKLTAVKLAKSAPQIGEKVMAVGNAGIGFLWAAKNCSVASVGERQEDSSRIAGFDCIRPDPELSPEEQEYRKKSCDERKKEITDALKAFTQGIAIQTDCAITHGDSGGPLVNAAGELVGLNQSIMADMATASFHVHLDEISDFIAKHAESGIAILPDPVCDAGGETTLEDIDLDGVPDTLLSKPDYSHYYGGSGHMSLLIDADESHLGAKKPGDTDWSPNDTPIALLQTDQGIFVWYDRDGDGRYDVLLYDKDSDGRPEVAYKINQDGTLTEDKTLLPHHDLTHRYLKSKSLEPRIAKIAMAVGGASWVSDITRAEGEASKDFPDPVLGGGMKGRAIDTTGDGKPDMVDTEGTFSHGYLIDIDDPMVAGMKTGDSIDDVTKLKASLHPKASIITQGQKLFAEYDTNNDGKVDLVLVDDDMGDYSDTLVATSAWRLGASGEPTAAPDQLGRRILRPDLISMSKSSASAFHWVGRDVASNEGLGSLPDPLKTSHSAHIRDIKGLPTGSVVDIDRGDVGVVLVDAQHKTKLPFKVKESDVQSAVRDGKFNADVAVVRRYRRSGNSSDWVFYDTDGDGKFDLVFYVAEVGREPAQAYRLKEGKLVPDSDVAKGKPFRYSVFKDKLVASKVKTVLPKVFGSGRAVEE